MGGREYSEPPISEPVTSDCFRTFCLNGNNRSSIAAIEKHTALDVFSAIIFHRLYGVSASFFWIRPVAGEAFASR